MNFRGSKNSFKVVQFLMWSVSLVEATTTIQKATIPLTLSQTVNLATVVTTKDFTAEPS